MAASHLHQSGGENLGFCQVASWFGVQPRRSNPGRDREERSRIVIFSPPPIAAAEVIYQSFLATCNFDAMALILRPEKAAGGTVAVHSDQAQRPAEELEVALISWHLLGFDI